MCVAGILCTRHPIIQYSTVREHIWIKYFNAPVSLNSVLVC